MPVRVSAGKERVLLAAMLARANQVVGVDDLADAVWDGSPPESARVTLQNYVKRLRQALGPAGYERIVTRPAGYLIEAAAGELDLTRFGQLQAAGRAAAQAGAWDRAPAELTTAHSLVRGAPPADVPPRGRPRRGPPTPPAGGGRPAEASRPGGTGHPRRPALRAAPRRAGRRSGCRRRGCRPRHGRPRHGRPHYGQPRHGRWRGCRRAWA